MFLGPKDSCLSVINSRSPSLEVKYLIVLLRIFSLISPIRIIWSSLVFQVFMSSARSEIKAVMGNSPLLILEN